MLGWLDSYVQKNEAGLLYILIHKNYSKLVIDLNIRHKAIKLLGKNIREILHDYELGKTLHVALHAQSTKEKINRLDFNKITHQRTPLRKYKKNI